MSSSQVKDLDCWNSVSVKLIAETLFEESNGDKRVLNTTKKSCLSENSIWGRCSELLLTTEGNTYRNRFLLMQFWKFNRKCVVDHYNVLYVQSKKTEKPCKNVTSGDWKGCICESYYCPLEEEERIECSKCERWWHPICADIDIDGYHDVDFICCLCSGEMKLPKLLEETNTCSFNTSRQQASLLEEKAEVSGMRTPLNNLHPLCSSTPKTDHAKLKADVKPSCLSDLSDVSEDDVLYVSDDGLENVSDDEGDCTRENKNVTPGPASLIEPCDTNQGQQNDFNEEHGYSSPSLMSDSESSDIAATKLDNNVGSDHVSSFTVASGVNIEDANKSSHSAKPSGDTTSIFEKVDAKSTSTQASTTSDSDDDFVTKPPKSTTSTSKTESVEEPKEKPVDVSKVKRNFVVQLPPDVWRRVVAQKKNTKGYLKTDFNIPATYRSTLSNAFDSVNKVCTLGFEKKLLGDPWGPAFFKAYAYCNNSKCSARWNFSVPVKPKPEKDVSVHVRMTSGEILHYRSKPSARRWMDDHADEAIRLLESNPPAAARVKMSADADMAAVYNGKLNSLKSLKTFQALKQKVVQAQDLDNDIVLDLVKTRDALFTTFPSNTLPGYIQTIQVFPAKCVLFSMQQMNLLKMRQTSGPVSLLLDATGGLVRKLGKPYDEKNIFLYTLLMQSSVKGHSAIPICEMLTSDHTHANIFTWLYHFFHTYQKSCNVSVANYGVLKIETDFSRPMITSVVRVFYKGSLDDYLNRFWFHYAGEQKGFKNLDIFAIHVCRFHILKTLRKKIVEHFSKQFKTVDFETKEFYLRWMRAIVRSKDLYSFDRRVKEVGVVALSQYRTRLVEKFITTVNQPTTRSGTPWEKFEFETQPASKSFWMRSAFGQYAYLIFESCRSKNAEKIRMAKAKGYEENPLFSENFAEYLQTYFLPYFPIVSLMVYEACGIPIVDDTNNAIENYFGLLKTNIYKQRRHQKISRFVRHQADVIKGICNLATAVDGMRGKTENEKSGNTNEKKTSHDKQTSKEPQANAANNVLEEDSDDENEIWASKTSSISEYKGKNYEKESPEKQKEKFKSTGIRNLRRTLSTDFMEFVPLVAYGGFDKLTNLRLRNTCNVDTSLQVLVALCSQFPDVKAFLKEMSVFSTRFRGIEEAVESAMHGNSDEAKFLWIREVMNKDPIALKGNLLASELDNAFQYIAEYFPVKKYHRCSREDCKGFRNPSSYPEIGSRRWHWENSNVSEMLKWSPTDFEQSVNFFVPLDTKCTLCSAPRVVKHEFNFSNRPFFFYPLLFDQARNFDERRIPHSQIFGEQRFELFAYTCVMGTLKGPAVGDDTVHHFITKFIVDGKKVVYDGLKPKPYVETQSPGDKVTSLWFRPMY